MNIKNKKILFGILVLVSMGSLSYCQSFSQVLEIPLHEALSMYGETIEGYIGKDIEFIVDNSLPEFRIELYNLYKAEQYENTVIMIKEVTWKYAKNKKITAWYEKQNNGIYIPKHYTIYSNDIQF
jgi:hypothetical protein